MWLRRSIPIIEIIDYFIRAVFRFRLFCFAPPLSVVLYALLLSPCSVPYRDTFVLILSGFLHSLRSLEFSVRLQ